VLAAAAARSYPRERVAVGVTADADRAAGVSAVVVALEVALVAEFAPSVAGVCSAVSVPPPQAARVTTAATAMLDAIRLFIQFPPSGSTPNLADGLT